MTVLEIAQVIYFFGPAYAADMSPIFARELFAGLDRPIDGGRTWRGTRLLGSHKTWRGLCACAVAGLATYEAQRFVHSLGWLRDLAAIDYEAIPVLPGLLMGLGAGVGDAAKSFFKRRVGIAPGATWLVFDQLDFFVGALVFVSLVYAPPLGVVLAAVPFVFVSEVAATTLFWRLGLKESWI